MGEIASCLAMTHERLLHRLTMTHERLLHRLTMTDGEIALQARNPSKGIRRPFCHRERSAAISVVDAGKEKREIASQARNEKLSLR